jgi:acyl-CoA synthetase (AMP-forming)/AMP-acid ligase II
MAHPNTTATRGPAPDVCSALLDYLRFWATETPNASAYIFGGQNVSYAHLAAQVDEMATALLSHGLQVGDRVAVLSTPRPEAWASFLATVSIGGVWVGLNPRYREQELAHVFRNSKPSLILGLRGSDDNTQLREAAYSQQAPEPLDFGSLDELTARLRETGTAETASDALGRRRDELHPSRPALIVYTSGSTGAPKGAVLPEQGVATSFAIEARHQDVVPARTIANLPINHIAGIGDLCCTTLVRGGTVIFQESFDPEIMIDAIEHLRVTVLMQIPTMLKLLVEHPRWMDADVSSLEAVYWGGAPLPETAADSFRARRIRLGSTYGMTEITGSVTYTDPDADDDTLATTVGRPIPETDLRILTENGTPVHPGEIGEIAVRHPGLMLEYFGAPEQTAEAFDADGYFLTGDVGSLLPDGNLRLTGRSNNMYKSGGENVYPREIEQVLESCPGVRMASVVPIPDPVFDEVGVAYCEIDLDSEIASAELQRWCRERIANYKIPKSFVLVSSLPRLPVGKIDRQQLIQRASPVIRTWHAVARCWPGL